MPKNSNGKQLAKWILSAFSKNKQTNKTLFFLLSLQDSTRDVSSNLYSPLSLPYFTFSSFQLPRSSELLEHIIYSSFIVLITLNFVAYFKQIPSLSTEDGDQQHSLGWIHVWFKCVPFKNKYVYMYNWITLLCTWNIVKSTMLQLKYIYIYIYIYTKKNK